MVPVFAALGLLGSVLAAGASGDALPAPPEIASGHPLVWSATLTVDAGAGYSGCRNPDPNLDDCSAALSDDEFSFDGRTHVAKP